MTEVTDEATWHRRYNDASDKLSAHDYAEAIRLFAALVASAPSEADQALAMAQIRVASDLANGVAPQPLPPQQPPSPQEVPPSDKPAPPPPSTYPTQPPRRIDELVWLYSNTLSYGLVSGIFIDSIGQEARNGQENHWPIALGTVLVAGLGATAVGLLDGGGKFRLGVPQSISSGMYIGLEQGLAWSLFDAKRGTYPNPSYLHTASLVWAFTTAGAITGGLIGSYSRVTPGEASWVGTLSLWPSLVLGGTAAAITGATNQTAYGRTQGAVDERNLGAVAGVTGVVGVVVGAFTAPLVQPSVSRTRFIDLAATLGGLFGGAFTLTAHNLDEAGVWGGIAIGSGLGFVTTLIATSWMKKDPIAAHFGNVLDNVKPTVTPVQGGLTLGLGGAL